jgi:hypothetical protein
MRKLLRYANLMVLGAGAVGMLLMLWLYSAGTDDRGLYPANHPGWVLLWILTGLVLVFMWLLSRQAGLSRNYRQNFPASLPAALGYLAGAVGLLSGGIHVLADDGLLQLLTGLCGIFGAASLLWGGFCRYRGLKSRLPVHILPCFFFALQLFVLGQEFGSEPELCRYLYRFFASAALVPACYWLWSFDVNLARRPLCLYWCLMAGYCSLIAVAGTDQWLLYGGMAVWILTALPNLAYLPKQTRQKPEAEVVPVPVEEAETEIPAPSEPEAKAEPKDPLSVELPDVDAILEELLRDFGKIDNSES